MKSSTQHNGIYKHALRDGDITYYIGIYDSSTGRQNRYKIGKKSEGITEKYCFNKRAEMIHLQRLGENPLKKNCNKVFFKELADEYFKYLGEKGKSEKSVRNEISRYKTHLHEILGDKAAASITPEDINKIIQLERKKNKSPATIKKIIGLISTIFNFGIKSEKYNEKNPCGSYKVESIKLDNSRERYLNKHEVCILLNDPRIKMNKLLDLFVRISLSTGARLGTVLAIQKKDLNINNWSLRLNNIKTERSYSGFLSQQLFENLNFVSHLKPNDYVVSIGGEKIYKEKIQKPLQKIFNELFNENLDSRDAKNRVVIHSLRHTFASNLAMAGVPLYNIQKLLDHKDQSMTMRYAKLAPDAGAQFVNILY